jgi:hypothetical protein
MIMGLATVRGALGAAELIAPGAMARSVDFHRPIGRRATMVVRVLGGRQLGQALLTGIEPDARVAAVGAVVDGVHALSMLALAWRSTRWRRPALAEAVGATVLAGAGATLAAWGGETSGPGRGRLRRAHRTT